MAWPFNYGFYFRNGKLIQTAQSDDDAALVSDARFPTTNEKAALAGTSGSPSVTNRYVTNADSRNSNARTPTAHATTHESGGSDEIDADSLEVTYVPTNYGPVGDTVLGDHLAEIDAALSLSSIVWLGVWDSGDAYNENDLVESNGSSWIAIAPSTNEEPPADPDDPSLYWELFARKGADGATGSAGAAGPGVVTGGSANQALTKINGTDYNTQWSTINATFVGLSNVTNVAQLPLSYLDTDVSLAANSDVKVPSQKAIKAYADAITTALGAHISDSSAAHASSAISVDSTTLVGVGTDLQAVLEELDNALATVISDAASHIANTSNPHSVTKAQVGLGNVTNDAQLKAADLDTDGTLAANSAAKIPSQSAVKTYADTKQPLDSDLTTLASLVATTDSFIQAKGSAWSARTVAQVVTDLIAGGLLSASTAASTYQPLDSDLTTIAALAATTDSFIQAKGSAWSARTVAQVVTDLIAGGLLSAATAASTYQPLDSDLTTLAGLTATTDNFIQAKSSAWASRTPAQVRTDLAIPVIINIGQITANGDYIVEYMPACTLSALHMSGTYTWTIYKDTGGGYSSLDTGTATENPLSGGSQSFNAGDKMKITISSYSAPGALSARGVGA